MPDRFEKCGLLVLVLQVVGVLPRVDDHQWHARLAEVALVVVDLRRQEASGDRLPDERAPARTHDGRGDFDQLTFELVESAKSRVMARASSPSGWPPALGARFVQKIECRMCPDRLN